MDQARHLSEVFRVKTRFGRSANVVLDYADTQSMDGYVITPLARAVLRRLAEGLHPDSRDRAWSLTGPYGAGKSSFALFAARLLGYPADESARAMLRSVDQDLYDDLFSHVPGLAAGGFLVARIGGSREPLGLALVRGLADTVASGPFSNEEKGEYAGWIGVVSERAQHGEPLPSSVLIAALERIGQLVRAHADCVVGLLVVIDEVGKLLEHAALNPSTDDIFLLQTLSEQAARSGTTPLAVLTILHQAFERYAASLGPVQQREWAKVGGRFTDIGFLEPPAAQLRLIGAAIERTVPLDGLGDVIASEAKESRRLDIAPRDLRRHEVEQTLEQCAPLHPVVSLLLGKLFRGRLAQNERSLFAFLTSHEPYGFQEYLHAETWAGDGHRPFYRVDQLYDYAVAALGSTLHLHVDGKRWAEIEDALERLPRDATALEARLVKAIGLLGLLGDQRRLKASREVLVYALADGKHVTPHDVETALRRLCESGIAVFRHYKSAYALWEGSDIDLDERFARALNQIPIAGDLAPLLQAHAPLRPYVAKRHLHQTGTLRFFTPWMVAASSLPEVLTRPFGAGDGAVAFVLGDGNGTVGDLVEIVRQASAELESPRRDLLFFAIPKDLRGIREALEEVMAVDFV